MDLPRVPWIKIQDVLRKVVLADLTATAQGIIKEFYVTNYYDAHLNPELNPEEEGTSPESQSRLYMAVAYEAAIARLSFGDSSTAMYGLTEEDYEEDGDE